jgi:exosortase K
VKAKLCVVIVAAALVWGLKHHYSVAEADDLWWVLTPTAALVEAITGAVFTATPGEGYFSREQLFLIEKSCAGINFMVAAFGMLVFTLFHRIGTGMSTAVVLGLSLMASYAAAVTVNAVRISIAMWLAAHPVGLVAFSAADVHRIEGIAVYFSGLVLLYDLARRSDLVARRCACRILSAPTAIPRVCRRAAVPLTAYYAVTLGIPLVNGAAQSEARLVDHAVTVIVVPLLMVALACALSANPHWKESGDDPERRRLTDGNSRGKVQNVRGDSLGARHARQSCP